MSFEFDESTEETVKRKVIGVGGGGWRTVRSNGREMIRKRKS